MKPLLFIAAVLLCSCSAEERLLRLLARNPQLRDTITVTLYDTVPAIVEYVHADTVFVPVPGDTVTIEKDRLRVRYVKMPGDTVWLEGECLRDTIYVPVKMEADVPGVAPTKIIKETKIPTWIPLVLMGLVATLVIVVIRKR